MKKMTVFLPTGLLLTSLLIPSPLRSIEISLQDSGKAIKIAYVSMHRIFEAFPETEDARIELNQMIDGKKEAISERKEAIAKLKGEIALIEKQLSAIEKPREAALAANQTENLPEGASSLTLPEGSPMKFIFSPPPESEGTENETEQSSSTLVSFSSSTPQILPGIPSVKPQLEEKMALLKKMELDLEAFVGGTEAEIRQLEEGKTMTLMAKIYKNLELIAARDGYSIILDKNNILYGENAIDITEDIIWRVTQGRPNY